MPRNRLRRKRMAKQRIGMKNNVVAAATAGQSSPPSPMITGMKGGTVCSAPLVSTTAHAYSLEPTNAGRKVGPKGNSMEFTKRDPPFEGPPITMLRERTRRSYQVCGGGKLARNSGVCRERVVNRLT